MSDATIPAGAHIDVSALPETDVLVIRGCGMDYASTHRLFDALHQRRPGTFVIFLGGDDSLEALDEDAMRQHGWIKADATA